MHRPFGGDGDIWLASRRDPLDRRFGKACAPIHRPPRSTLRTEALAMRLPRLFSAALLATSLFATTLSAQPQPAPAGASGQPYRSLRAKELLAGIDEGALAAPTPDPARQRELSTGRAMAYVYGVADITTGKAWCPPPRLAISELASLTYDYLAKLPAARLNDPASVVVVQALSAAHPCK
ncbi:Rap1a/Tai family immunity protein [Pseudomonas sp. Hp2]|uniref:Rap1a/Tai family immunity protein n=1 Tax=Pseudomonas sp. Hp2 TaxID=701189 RepID=UPI00112B2237|nr:Rap1a/Tai family immunity protein [Pseudomonas sp. Hp2]